MTAVTFMDELVREYLLFRGFVATVKSFDTDIKNDKDKGFRADKIVEQLTAYISNYDLVSLRETWSHMDQRIFCRLEHQFMATVRKLENSLLKMYIVNTIQTNKHDKLVEFFERTGQELQNQPEWKDWFVLPFLKNPEENPSFAGYFTRQWQETMLASLQNFLSVIFQCMPLPVLMSYEDEINRINQLQEENDMLRQQVAALQAREITGEKLSPLKMLDSDDGDATGELMDDFYVIAQETPASDNQVKSIRSIIRNISSGLPTSPILGRRPSAPSPSMKKPIPDSEIVGKTGVKPKTRVVTTGIHMSTSVPSAAKSRTFSESEAKKSVLQTRTEDNVLKQKDALLGKKGFSIEMKSGSELQEQSSIIPMGNIICEGDGNKSPLLLLSQEEYGEHQSAITHCKFNASGTLIASSDIDGVIKIWSPSPSPTTLFTAISKSSVLALEWAHKQERLLLHGNRTGLIKLYDTKQNKTLWEIGNELSSPIKDQKIVNLACSPSELYFVSSTAAKLRSVASDVNSLVPSTGNLILWDMKVKKLLKHLNLRDELCVANYSIFNHNGQLLLVGSSHGKMYLFDMRSHECINHWKAHDGETHTVVFSADETTCYSMGTGGKFCQWSINKTGQKLSEHILSDKCAGPFVNPSGPVNQRYQYHRPMGKLFSFDSEGKHVLSCANTTAIISQIPDSKEPPKALLRLDGHKMPVITTDWATTVDCGTCITASLDGKIRVSTLLAQ